jgi:hypothetical protein
MAIIQNLLRVAQTDVDIAVVIRLGFDCNILTFEEAQQLSQDHGIVWPYIA